jgi:hypothetical protein
MSCLAYAKRPIRVTFVADGPQENDPDYYDAVSVEKLSGESKE